MHQTSSYYSNSPVKNFVPHRNLLTNNSVIIADARSSISSVDTSQNTCASVMDALYELHPELNDHINMNCLLPYLNKYKILTGDERFYLSDASKAPSEKVNYLLHLLEGKGSNAVDNFLRALRAEKKHSGHSMLCSLLVQKGVKL